MQDRMQIEQYIKEALLMQGQLLTLNDEKINIVAKVEKAKKWLAKQPDYLKFLNHAQELLHRKNIGAFSELLSYFVKDVLQKEKDIVLDLYTFRNLPALRIEAQNPDKKDDKGRPFKENIYEGNGGSIVNIVATGIRLIALSRLNHRKFIVLDESDCWLAPHHVPIFSRIIGEISEKLKIQTVIISHHHWSNFQDYGRVIELKSDGVHLTTEILHDTVANNPPENFITNIVLRRFMSHYDTNYQLHPYLTCIVGENDIGKSVISAAMKAVAYGDSSDSYIMHNEPEAQIMVQLSDKRQILWQRVLETSQDFSHKVKYSEYLDGVAVGHGEYNSSEAPKFVSDALKILLTEDIDLHIGNQKDPAFLLSSQVKPQERAKILSLGKESLIIQKMMENVKTKTREYNRDERDGELRYNVIEKTINVLKDIQDIVDLAENTKTEHYFIDKQQLSIDDIDNDIKSLDRILPIVRSDFINIKSLAEPQIEDTNALDEIIEQITYHREVSRCPNINYHLDNITIQDSDTLDSVIKDLSYHQSVASFETISHHLSAVEIQDTRYLDNAIEQMHKVSLYSALSLCDTHIDPIELNDVEELNYFISQLSILASVSNISLCDNLSHDIQLISSEHIDDTIHALESAAHIGLLSTIEIDLPSIELNDMDSLTAIIHQIEENHKQRQDLQQKRETLVKWEQVIADESKEYEEGVKKLELEGLICSKCKQPLTGNHLGELHA